MNVKPLSDDDIMVSGRFDDCPQIEVQRLKELFAELDRCITDKDFHSLDVNGNWIFYRALHIKINELFGPLIKKDLGTIGFTEEELVK